MKKLRLYDYFESHHKVHITTMVVAVVVFAVMLFTLHFSEDIGDFLPLDTTDREAFSVYQGISGADGLYIVFSNPDDEEKTVDAIDFFVKRVKEIDTEAICDELVSRFDVDDIASVTHFVYANIPYFLKEEDIERMDSLLAAPNYVQEQLCRDKNALMFPSGPFAAQSVSMDPLGLFAPVLERLQVSDSRMSFEMYDGYIFTPDMTKAVVMTTSRYGNSETQMNSRLLSILNRAIQDTEDSFDGVKVHIVGGPAIAVENSTRIKKDSIIAISLSAVLIVLLLFLSFNSIRNIILIFLSVGWGLLFAMGTLAMFRDSVSIIVIGISSIILGIAVNYPLHLVAHNVHQSDRRACLKEIISPLVVGNITTVGAFLALVPLKSPALRDLGLFASLLLVGTILFTLIYLPHFIKTGAKQPKGHKILEGIGRFCPDRSRLAVISVAIVTVVLAYFSLSTGFDSDMSHINYMSRQQKEDMQYFEQLLSADSSKTARDLYVLSRGDNYAEALAESEIIKETIDSLKDGHLIESSHCAQDFITSNHEQKIRLDRWRDFVMRHYDTLTGSLNSQASKLGFSSTAFAPFEKLISLSGQLEEQEIGFFDPLTSSIFKDCFTSVPSIHKSYVVSRLSVQPEHLPLVKDCLKNSFDVQGMNGALTKSLSDNFNYIGWVCSLIVFFFLWFSFGRLELALISFLPMALSWVWILGLMSLFGIKFNIVNIILATFIFGQGDDYTIFITEGCQWEYARRRSILPSYKISIAESALIMFVGMGTLIVARHPAMRSLAEVTIIGMFSVVLMSYMLPPLLFRWITRRRDGTIREYPLTISYLLKGAPKKPISRVLARYRYKGKDVESRVFRSLRSSGHLLTEMKCDSEMVFSDCGYGEQALLLALTHPDSHIIAMLQNEDSLLIAQGAADGFVDNIEFKTI